MPGPSRPTSRVQRPRSNYSPGPARPRSRPGTRHEAAAAGLTGLMALVVDDEPGLRLLIPAMLEELGIASETAPSGEEALSKLERRPIDMVLADLHLAGMDGGELFRRVTEWRPDLARRFLFVTGDWLSSESRTLLEETQCPFLRKPFEVEELLDAVKRLIRGR